MGTLKIVELLIAANADIDKRTPDEVSAVFVATSLGHHRIVKLLLRNGAEI